MCSRWRPSYILLFNSPGFLSTPSFLSHQLSLHFPYSFLRSDLPFSSQLPLSQPPPPSFPMSFYFGPLSRHLHSLSRPTLPNIPFPFTPIFLAIFPPCCVIHSTKPISIPSYLLHTFSPSLRHLKHYFKSLLFLLHTSHRSCLLLTSSLAPYTPSHPSPTQPCPTRHRTPRKSCC